LKLASFLLGISSFLLAAVAELSPSFSVARGTFLEGLAPCDAFDYEIPLLFLLLLLLQQTRLDLKTGPEG
jgi:hypothetical protein